MCVWCVVFCWLFFFFLLNLSKLSEEFCPHLAVFFGTLSLHTWHARRAGLAELGASHFC